MNTQYNARQAGVGLFIPESSVGFQDAHWAKTSMSNTHSPRISDPINCYTLVHKIKIIKIIKKFSSSILKGLLSSAN